MDHLETELSPAGKPPRYRGWVSLFIFSCVALAAFVSTEDANSSSSKWVLSVLVISLALSFLAVIAYLIYGEGFIGDFSEGGLAAFLFIFWCAGLPVIMNPGKDYAVGVGHGISNANLYFSSWISFSAILYISLNYLEQLVGHNYVSEVNSKTAKWCALMAASFVLMCTASQYHSDVNCKNSDSDTCRRNKYAISLGVIGAVFSVGMAYTTNKGLLDIKPELLVSSFLAILYIFGVGFITFGSGPGAEIGNLYFSTWIGQVVSFLLAAECLRELLALMSIGPPAATNGAEQPQFEIGEASAPTPIEATVPTEVAEETY